MKRILLFIILVLPVVLYAQDKSVKRDYNQANQLVLNGNLEEALEIYKEIITKYPDNSNYNYKIGYIYFETQGMRDYSKDFLIKASENVSKNYSDSYKETKAPLETWYYLGLLNHYEYEFDIAKEYFNKYLESATDDDKIEKVETLIKACDSGIELVMNPLDLDIMELGGNINSKYEEHSPLITADLSTLIFTSKREGTGGDKDENGDYYEDIYISKFENGDWTNPISISSNINTNDHEASSGLSYDGRMLFIYKPVNEGDLFVSYLQNDVWSEPESLGPFVNTEFRETSATLSIDGQTLYFTSNRPGGYGELDIWMSNLQEDGSWGVAKNIGGKLNSKLNEEGPYLHPSDTVMYFSSNGHPGMGGYDLFMSINKGGEWNEPKNIGYPLNSPDDDVYFISSPEGNYGFYASNQYGSSGSTNIYTLKLPSQFKTNIAVLAGNIILNEGDGGANYSNVSIKVIDNETGDTISTYKPDPVNGMYALALPTPKEYTIVYEAYGHLPQVETVSLTNEADLYNLKKVLPLQPITFGNTGQSYTVKFDPNTSELTVEGDAILQSMVDNINNYDELVAQVVLPYKDDLMIDNQKETILSYLYRNVVDTTRIQVIEKSDEENFEVFLADTSFLNFGKTKWVIEFDEYQNITPVSEYKLNQIAYYLKNDNSLCIQIPIYKNGDEAVNEERAKEIYNFIQNRENSITKQLIVWQVADNTAPPSDKSLELVVTDKYPGAITLFEVIGEALQKEEEEIAEKCILQDQKAETIVLTLYFDFGKYIVDDILEAEDIITCLNKNTDISVTLKGHTDDIGSNELNFQLGLKRAQYLKQYFVKQGVKDSQIIVSSDGETKPIAPNSINGADNPEGRKLNRRVEVIITKK